jgi:hypothetical protein
LTRGRAATPDPFDLGAVAGSDELFEALSTRRLTDLTPGPTGDEDPAAALLAALVAEVDAGAPPLPVPARVACGMPGTRRRGVRAFVAFGVAAVVLTSAGAAAAGGGGGVSALRTTHGPVRTGDAERSNANAQKHAPSPVLVDRREPDHAEERRQVESPGSEPGHALDGSNDHGDHRSSRSNSHPPTDIHHRPLPTPAPGTPSPEPSVTPTPAPGSPTP